MLRLFGGTDYDPRSSGISTSAVVAHLKGQQIHALFAVRRQYTAADRRKAELLILGPGVDVHSVEGTLRWEDVSICPFCDSRTADWQFGLLRIVEQPQGAAPAVVDHWPRVVSTEVAQVLRQAGVTGLELAPVGPVRPVQWYGVRATHRLPPVAVPPTRLRANPLGPTSQCATDHLWGGLTRSQLAYRRQDLAAADFNVTYEYFGDMHTATPHDCNLATGVRAAARGWGQAAVL